MLLRRHGRLPNLFLRPTPLRSLPSSPSSQRFFAEVASSEKSQDVAILGAGITGLTAAYYLARETPDAKITVYEAGESVGGWMQSKWVDVEGGRILFEEGPRTLRPQDNGAVTLQLIQDLRLIPEVQVSSVRSPAAQNRFIYYPDHLVRMPHPSHGLVKNIYNLITEPVFKGGLNAAINEWREEPRSTTVTDESVGNFFSRRLGHQVTDNLVSAVMHGIYAGNIYQLSVKSLFPAAWFLEKEYGGVLKGLAQLRGEQATIQQKRMVPIAEEFGSGIHLEPDFRIALAHASVYTFQRGLGSLAETLKDRLVHKHNVQMKTNTAAQSVAYKPNSPTIELKHSGSESTDQYDCIISTLPANATSKICCDPSSTTPRVPSLGLIPSVTVMVVNLFFTNADLVQTPGFGYLLPRSVPFDQNPEFALGVIFDSYAAPEQDSVPGSKFTVMLGGHWWDGWDAFPDGEQGIAMARTVLARHLGIVDKPVATHATLQRDCIPQYTVGHEDRMKQAHRDLESGYRGKLKVAGNTYAGVGVNDCVRAGRDVARSVARGLKSANGQQVTRETGLQSFIDDEGFRVNYHGRKKD
ncbi:Protoporphyrinogen oxidase [Aulographum hederae CBS 113979]|uniref:Protoporphyrinogen oxidase n=1 Tax=Aulographum hederae CBS 113979 TaxID=1176131 RepID=A0A6G1GUB5_9PEZI|nr:Protoporphyrinogen oxidase [Aulographum hederae CBS 113979]